MDNRDDYHDTYGRDARYAPGWWIVPAFVFCGMFWGMGLYVVMTW
jgi:hypothetical protein